MAFYLLPNHIYTHAPNAVYSNTRRQQSYSVPFSTLKQTSLSLHSENVAIGVDREEQQNPANCAAPANAPPVENEGTNGVIRCTRWTRGGLRGTQQEEVRGPRQLPEPPDLQEASGAGGGGVRVL